MPIHEVIGPGMIGIKLPTIPAMHKITPINNRIKSIIKFIQFL